LNDGDYEAAAHRFETAGQLEWKPGKALAWRALTYLYLERHQPALAAHTELLAVSASRVDLMADQNCIKYNMGWISAHLGKLGDAEKFFRQVEDQSIPGSSVPPWLDWLDTKPVSAPETVPDEALPEFCEVLVPRMKVVKPSDFSPVSS
jgi:tetratricopeptide (TPR) repeat protein